MSTENTQNIDSTDEIEDTVEATWFSTRCVFHHPEHGVYEERITVWLAPDVDTAIEFAEGEAEAYAQVNGIQYNGFVQAYAMFDDLQPGSEVFSLGRTSDLPEEEYLTRFFHTGSERQRESEAELEDEPED